LNGSTHRVGAYFYGSATRQSKGTGPIVPEFFGTSYMRAHTVRSSNQMLDGDQTM